MIIGITVYKLLIQYIYLFNSMGNHFYYEAILYESEEGRKCFMINLHKRMLPTQLRSNPQPPDHQLDTSPDHQLDTYPTEHHENTPI